MAIHRAQLGRRQETRLVPLPAEKSPDNPATGPVFPVPDPAVVGGSGKSEVIPLISGPLEISFDKNHIVETDTGTKLSRTGARSVSNAVVGILKSCPFFSAFNKTFGLLRWTLSTLMQSSSQFPRIVPLRQQPRTAGQLCALDLYGGNVTLPAAPVTPNLSWLALADVSTAKRKTTPLEARIIERFAQSKLYPGEAELPLTGKRDCLAKGQGRLPPCCRDRCAEGRARAFIADTSDVIKALDPASLPVLGSHAPR